MILNIINYEKYYFPYVVWVIILNISKYRYILTKDTLIQHEPYIFVNIILFLIFKTNFNFWVKFEIKI